MYVPGMAVISLFTAYLLNTDVRLKGLWRVLIYLPTVIPVLAVVILGKFIFYPEGLMNMGLSIFGIHGPSVAFKFHID